MHWSYQLAFLACAAGCFAQAPVTLTNGVDTYMGTLTKKAATTSSTAPTPVTPVTAVVYPSGLPAGIFGTSYALNQPVNTLPVDTRQIAYAWGNGLAVTNSDTVNHSVQTSIYGSTAAGLVVTPNMPVTVVNSAQHPELLVNVTYTPDAYLSESDSIDPNYTGPNGQKRTRLIPVKNAVIEGPSGNGGDGTDSHIIAPDLATMLDYELYHVTRNADGSLTAQQVTVWDMKTGQRVSDSGCDKKLCTSADAAGLPILAGLVRDEEVRYAVTHNLPDIGHAIRVTYKWSRQGAGGSAGWFVAPATHAAGNGGGRPVVMGMRMRIPAAYTKPNGLSAYDTVIWNTLVNYGDVVADNGGTGYLIGDTGAGWTSDHNLSLPTGFLLNQMEVVNTGCWVNANRTKDNTGIIRSGCR